MRKLLLILLSALIITAEAQGYETNVHQAITTTAIAAAGTETYIRTYLNINPIDLFNGTTATGWMESGSISEDNFPRPLNHFYDPTTGMGLFNGKSSLQWAKDDSNNEWDWGWARHSYYSALTSTQTTDRSTWFAHLFRGLGQIMHLVQDKSVPAHVRNDAHFPYLNSQRDMYERYTRDNFEQLNYSGYSPVELSIFNNLDKFWINGGKGLAEYTNRNFLSRDTNIDDAKYALPAPIGDWTTTETVGGNQYTVKYLQGYATDSYRSSASTPISRLSAYSYMDFEMNKYGSAQRVYSLNNKIHKEYADLLVPRAVGYSAGFLNYFFRGTIDIAPPTTGGYSLIDATQQGYTPAFTAIKLKATNTTTTGESMTNGTIQLVVKYKMAQTDPFVAGQVATSADFFYTVVPEKNNVSALYSATPTELNFDLTGQNAIPLWATDLYIQVVFKGTLGTEADAVAVGFKDISEPTPIDIFNNMDKICINGSWYDAGSAAAIAQVDANHNGIADTNEADVYKYDLKNIYLRFSPYNQNPPYYWASSSAHNIAIPYLYAGDSVRAAYLLSDYMFNKGQYLTWVKTDTHNLWSHPDVNWLWWFGAVKRQRDYSEDSGLCGGAPPCYVDVYPVVIPTFSGDNILGFHTFRNTTIWWGSGEIWVNTPYPSNSVCSMDAL